MRRWRGTDEHADAVSDAVSMIKPRAYSVAAAPRRLAAPIPVRSRRLIAAIDAIVGINALGGMAYALGGARAVPTEWLKRSPFSSYRIPGLYLGAVVGGSCLLAAWAAARDDRRARPAALASSGLMLSWIAAQLQIIGYRSPLQPAIAATAAAVGYLAVKE
jgi:hypothetical protein